MPLARIDLIKGKPPAYRKTIGEVVYDAMIHVINVPEEDRFQVIAEHEPHNFIYNPQYMGIERSADCIFIQITLNAGRSVEMKKAFYRSCRIGRWRQLSKRWKGSQT